MPFEIVTVPCLRDNYAYLLREKPSGAVALVDAPEAPPIAEALEARGWGLDAILVTHHHSDHVDGVEALRSRFGARVIGAAADKHRLPRLDDEVADGDLVQIGGAAAQVLDVPGHTRGHVAYHLPEAGALFSADSLMVMGCGRLFEGTAEEMWNSLHKLAALPEETMVYSGHEYAASNVRFALSVDGENLALLARAEEIETLRHDGRPTVPASLRLERLTNPFLRVGDPAIRAALRREFAFDLEVFAELRRRKDVF